MSEATSGNDGWPELWADYTRALENWGRVFESVQKASSEMQESFGRVMEKAAGESSADTMKRFGESWQKAMGGAGAESLRQFGEGLKLAAGSEAESLRRLAEGWQKSLGAPPGQALAPDEVRRLAEGWQKSLSTSGMKQMRAYGDMMKKFAETWDSMWPKKA